MQSETVEAKCSPVTLHEHLSICRLASFVALKDGHTSDCSFIVRSLATRKSTHEREKNLVRDDFSEGRKLSISLRVARVEAVHWVEEL